MSACHAIGPQRATAAAVVLAAVALTGCGDKDAGRPGNASRQDEAGTGQPAGTLTLTSPAFAPGERIPARYTGEGENISPALRWTGLPEGAAELALIVDDPDAPRGTWVHWVLYGIPATAAGLPEAVPPVATLARPAGAVQGVNSWSRTGYGGPMPPRGHGVHHYHFRLYALDKRLALPAGLTRSALLAAIGEHVIGKGELVGLYERK